MSVVVDSSVAGISFNVIMVASLCIARLIVFRGLQITLKSKFSLEPEMPYFPR